MLLAVGKVVVEMIAVVFEDIVVFILDFPTDAVCANGLHANVIKLSNKPLIYFALL